MILSIIAAYAEDKNGNRVIGRENQLPWHFPHDLKRFKQYTLGKAVIMGRKTYESIGRSLPGRDNIIVTRQQGYVVDGAFVFGNLEDAVAFTSVRHGEAFIIGGQELYEQMIDETDRLYLTSFQIDGIAGDAYFPDFDPTLFEITHEERSQISGDCFRILDRKTPQLVEIEKNYMGHSV
jgi:dihydrofolate reductase